MPRDVAYLKPETIVKEPTLADVQSIAEHYGLSLSQSDAEGQLSWMRATGRIAPVEAGHDLIKTGSPATERSPPTGMGHLYPFDATGEYPTRRTGIGSGILPTS